jgi:hypothetical protein
LHPKGYLGFRNRIFKSGKRANIHVEKIHISLFSSTSSVIAAFRVVVARADIVRGHIRALARNPIATLFISAG